MAGVMDTQLLAAGGVATDQGDLTAANIEGLGKKADQVGIGLALDGRGGNADLQGVAVGADYLVPAGARLQADREQQVRALPAIPTHYCANGPAPVRASSSGITSMRMTCRPRSATSGDRSKPLMGGSNRRTGRSTGSVRLNSTEVTGL